MYFLTPAALRVKFIFITPPPHPEVPVSLISVSLLKMIIPTSQRDLLHSGPRGFDSYFPTNGLNTAKLFY